MISIFILIVVSVSNRALRQMFDNPPVNGVNGTADPHGAGLDEFGMIHCPTGTGGLRYVSSAGHPTARRALPRSLATPEIGGRLKENVWRKAKIEIGELSQILGADI
jgi:hypothetical protein